MSQNIKKEIYVAIIGGGFTGLSLAIGLQRHQVSCQVYEASSAFSEMGAGITFAPNGINAMLKIHPIIQQKFLEHATANGFGSHRDIFLVCSDGRTDEAGILYPNEGHAYQSIHRATFLSILASLLSPGTIHFSKRLESAVEKDGMVELFFADGSKAIASTVLGCDGVRSHLRSFVTGQEPTYSGIYSYRGLTRMDRAIDVLGEELAMTGQNYFGNGSHVITYPIEDGALLNIVGCKFDPEGKWMHDRWQISSTSEQMMADFAHMGAPARRAMSLVDSSDRWAVFDLSSSLSPFHRGRMALVGDAAHCTTPHTGSGASLALEDAYVLAEMIHEMRNANEIYAVLHAFDSIRRPRTQAVIVASRESADIYQFRKPGAEDIVAEMTGRHEWIWDIDLDRHLGEARKAFQAYLRSA